MTWIKVWTPVYSEVTMKIPLKWTIPICHKVNNLNKIIFYKRINKWFWMTIAEIKLHRNWIQFMRPERTLKIGSVKMCSIKIICTWHSIFKVMTRMTNLDQRLNIQGITPLIRYWMAAKTTSPTRRPFSAFRQFEEARRTHTGLKIHKFCQSLRHNRKNEVEEVWFTLMPRSNSFSIWNPLRVISQLMISFFIIAVSLVIFFPTRTSIKMGSTARNYRWITILIRYSPELPKIASRIWRSIQMLVFLIGLLMHQWLIYQVPQAQ